MARQTKIRLDHPKDVAKYQARAKEHLAEMVALAEHLKRPALIFTFFLDALAMWSQEEGKQWQREKGVSVEEWARLTDSPEVQRRAGSALSALNPSPVETTRKLNRGTGTAADTSNDPLGEGQEVTKRINGLFSGKASTWAEFNKFVAEQGPAITKEFGLKKGDLEDGGLGFVAWLAHLSTEAEREQQPRVDAAIGYLDPSIPE